MSFINTIDQLGDDVVFASILDRSIAEFKDNVLTSVRTYVFHSCQNLSIVDLSVTSIGSTAFYNCKNLSTFVLRSNTICILTASAGNVFFGSQIKNKNGYIYVPRALLSDEDEAMDYRRATNWTEFSSQFRILEDFTVDGTTTGELDLTKI